jgi:predicted RNA-binding protein YlxR (DUF448 family)
MNVERSLNERESQRARRGSEGRGESRRHARTCVGCGQRDDATALLRIVVTEGEPVVSAQSLGSERAPSSEQTLDIAFDLAGGSFGRGAHVHATSACIEKAPRGLARAFRGAVRFGSEVIGARLVEACDRRMGGLLLAAHRSRVLAIGADAAIEALERGAPLAVLAVDAGSVAATVEIERCVAAGRAMAWRTRSELGSLLGERSVAICAVRHAGIAAELKRMRAAADAGAAAKREGAECSRFPEAR